MSSGLQKSPPVFMPASAKIAILAWLAVFLIGAAAVYSILAAG